MTTTLDTAVNNLLVGQATEAEMNIVIIYHLKLGRQVASRFYRRHRNRILDIQATGYVNLVQTIHRLNKNSVDSTRRLDSPDALVPYLKSCISGGIRHMLHHDNIIRVPNDEYRKGKPEHQFRFVTRFKTPTKYIPIFDIVEDRNGYAEYDLEDWLQVAKLSQRQRIVLEGLRFGYSQPELAKRLGYSVPTISRVVKSLRVFFTQEKEKWLTESQSLNEDCVTSVDVPTAKSSVAQASVIHATKTPSMSVKQLSKSQTGSAGNKLNRSHKSFVDNGIKVILYQRR